MRIMKYINFFLAILLITCSCKKPEEQAEVDLDEMVQGEEEVDTSYLAGDPIDSPQEIHVKELPSGEAIDPSQN